MGGIAYYSSDECWSTYSWYGSSISVNGTNVSGCRNDYASSDIKRVVDNWAKDKLDDLVEIDGYKARILSIDELIS